MGRRKEYKGFLDSPQDIADCLSCRRPICMNCKEKSGISTGTGISRREVRAFEAALVAEYASCNSCEELIEKLQSNKVRVSRVLKRLSLPNPSEVTAEERHALARKVGNII